RRAIRYHVYGCVVRAHRDGWVLAGRRRNGGLGGYGGCRDEFTGFGRQRANWVDPEQPKYDFGTEWQGDSNRAERRSLQRSIHRRAGGPESYLDGEQRRGGQRHDEFADIDVGFGWDSDAVVQWSQRNESADDYDRHYGNNCQRHSVQLEFHRWLERPFIGCGAKWRPILDHDYQCSEYDQHGGHEHVGVGFAGDQYADLGIAFGRYDDTTLQWRIGHNSAGGGNRRQWHDCGRGAGVFEFDQHAQWQRDGHGEQWRPVHDHVYGRSTVLQRFAHRPGSFGCRRDGDAAAEGDADVCECDSRRREQSVQHI